MTCSTSAILMVDNDALFARAVARDLGRRGFTIDVAREPMEALAAVSRLPYGVVIADEDLGSESGLALIEQVHAVAPRVVCCLASKQFDLALAREAVNVFGVRFLVTKPWREHELTEVLQRALSIAADEAAVQHSLADARERLLRAQHLAEHLERLLQGQQDGMLAALLDILSQKSPWVQRHGKRLAALALPLADSVGLGHASKQALTEAALLHDLSTMAVPDVILMKPGPLLPQERQIMRTHIDVGRRLLQDIGNKPEASAIFVQHHERWDGSGYPHGLRSEEICLGARIFAVADAADAITSDRPYRRGASLTDARTELQRCAGTQFDPEVVAACDRLLSATAEEMY